MPKGAFDLPPTSLDMALSKAAPRAAQPQEERTLRIFTWLADETLMLTGIALFWMGAHLAGKSDKVKREADRMLLSVAIAGLLPDLFKRLINRKRPNRTLVHGRRHGIPRSGDPYDSFPSGHALHIGAIAAPAMHMVSSRARPAVLLGLGGLAVTRILLLAHYASDVVAGLALGAGLSAAVSSLLRKRAAITGKTKGDL